MIGEVYEKIGGSYENARNNMRLDRLIEKYVLRFPTDPTFALLTEAMENEDVQRGFVASHTLKGVALNLAFERLAGASAALTDAMRENMRGEYTWAMYRELFVPVREEYQMVIDAITEYQKE